MSAGIVLRLRVFRVDLLLSIGPLLDFLLEQGVLGFLHGIDSVHSLLYVCTPRMIFLGR